MLYGFYYDNESFSLFLIIKTPYKKDNNPIIVKDIKNIVSENKDKKKNMKIELARIPDDPKIETIP